MEDMLAIKVAQALVFYRMLINSSKTPPSHLDSHRLRNNMICLAILVKGIKNQCKNVKLIFQNACALIKYKCLGSCNLNLESFHHQQKHHSNHP